MPANTNQPRFDDYQFQHGPRPVGHAESTGEGLRVTNGIGWDDYERMGTETHKPRNPMWIPPFAASVPKIRKVILYRAWQYCYAGGHLPDKVDWQELNQRATAKALAKQISPSASAYEHEILAKHQDSVRRLTYMELQAAVCLSPASFEDFASLYDAANPSTESDKALVAGYWLQIIQGTSDWSGFSANKELRNLGHGVENITVALGALIDSTPRLVMQTHKAGKTKQARKKYKVTGERIKRVKQMMAGTAEKE